ncbi:LysR family transcriptional regulator [Yinghuangia sp. YIM S09857]|uniref:LysR family transcriptional regulator n=1 Tax=Yinghuangia sp. YIM S09857 TaxID=3436929 RepID=UPI003F52BF01
MAQDGGTTPRLTVHQLRRLVAVAEHGSISAAAAALYLAQPALSKSLLELERSVGTRLLARTNRGTVLSPDGRRAVRLARTILADVHALEALAREEPPDDSGGSGPEPLRIAATPTLANDLGTHLVPTFATSHPNLRLRLIRSASRDALFDALRRGEADAGVAALPAPDDLIADQFAVREVVLVSPAGLDLPDTLSQKHLDGLPLVLPPPGAGRRDDIDRAFRHLGIKPVVAMEAEERSAWVACVLAGLGSVFLYRDLVEHLGYEGTDVRGFEPPVRGAVALIRRPRDPAGPDTGPGADGDGPDERVAAFLAHARANGLRPAPAS